VDVVQLRTIRPAARLVILAAISSSGETGQEVPEPGTLSQVGAGCVAALAFARIRMALMRAQPAS